MFYGKNRDLDREVSALVGSFTPHESVLHEVGIRITYNDFLSDKMMLIKAIHHGLPYSLFEQIQQVTPFSDEDWAQILDVSTKSLQRYKASADHTFKSIHSEKILEMAEVTHLGMEVFGSKSKFNHWLNTPSYALSRMKPIDLLMSSYGKEMVMSELIHINHGILV